MVKRYEIIGHDWYPSEEATGTYVTNADYRELEEINRQLVDKSNRLTIITARLEEELESIKARVGELVAADRAFDACIISGEIDDQAYDNRQKALGYFS